MPTQPELVDVDATSVIPADEEPSLESGLIGPDADTDTDADADAFAETDAPEERTRATDASLGRWRAESVDRRVAWEAEVAWAETRRRERLRRRVVAGAIAAVVAPVVVALWLLGTAADRPARAGLAPSPTPASPASAVVVAAEVEAPPVTAPPETPAAAAPASDADAVAVAETLAPEPAAEPSPAPSPAPITPGRIWVRGGYVWTDFQVDATASSKIAWFDAKGVEALERMPCAAKATGAERRCHAGRSQRRIAHALAGGASEGRWTVRSCRGADCAVVGAFTVPLQAH